MIIIVCLLTLDWVNDDLIAKIDQSATLSKAFNDPTLLNSLELFHKNPKAALAAAQESPEVANFLQEFCSLMGDHFNSLADKQEKLQEEPLITEKLTEGERNIHYHLCPW